MVHFHPVEISNQYPTLVDSKKWQKFPVGLSVPKAKPKMVLPPVDLNMTIAVTNPKAHIMNLFPDLSEAVGTMENVQVHLDVNFLPN